MGVESEGEEEKVELSEGEVDVLEREGAADGDDDDAGLLPSDDDDGDSGDEGAGGAGGVRSGAACGRACPQQGACVRCVRARRSRLGLP